MYDAISSGIAADTRLSLEPAPLTEGSKTASQSGISLRNFGFLLRSGLIAALVAISGARQIWTFDDPAPSVAEFFFALRREWAALWRGVD